MKIENTALTVENLKLQSEIIKADQIDFDTEIANERMKLKENLLALRL